jgi:signal transduction histidine kinase
LVTASVLLTKTIRSTTFKLALFAIALFGAIVLGLLGYVYASTLAYVRGEFDRAIMVNERVMERSFQREGRAGVITEIEQHLSHEPFAGDIYLLTDASFGVLAGNLNSWPAAYRTIPAKGTRPEEWSDGSNKSTVRASMYTLPNGDHLLLGKKLDAIDAFRTKIWSGFVATIILILLLTALATVSVTRRTIGRIESINAASRAIIQSDLKKRIPVRGTSDEWDQVAGNLNHMLDRIDRLMGELRQATDNVAHDLRTPLTRIRGRLERAYNQASDSDCHRDLIGDTIVELDAVLRVFASLTRISQIEANVQRSTFCMVNLFEVASKAVELYEAAADEMGARLNLIGGEPTCVMGDRDLLFDAISNLLDNAIKYGPKDGEVVIEITNGSGRPAISVADNGPGIPAEEYSNVLKRFYRLEQSRHAAGNGLGLSLVAAVAHIHEARIEMHDNSPGLKVQLTFSAGGSSAMI